MNGFLQKLSNYLKSFSPFIHSCLKSIRSKIIHKLAHARGTAYYEKKWARWSGHRAHGREGINCAWDSRWNPHRTILLHYFSSLSEVESALEIGCNCGQNLFLLARTFPEVRFQGLDINQEIINFGKEKLVEHGLDNVQLNCAKISDLAHIPSKQYTLVFSDAVLMYLAPDTIRTAMANISRVASRYLFLLEWHSDEIHGTDGDLGYFSREGWVRNYRTLMENTLDDYNEVSIQKIPQGMRSGGQWPELGHFITVRL